MSENIHNIILFYGNLQMGGIQSLIVRLANWLVSKNIGVTVVLESGGELTPLLDNRIKLIFYGKYSFFLSPNFFSHFFPSLMQEQFDAAISFDFTSLLVATLFYTEYPNLLRFANGVYHPNAIEKEIESFSQGSEEYRNLYSHLYRELLDDSSKIFMNRETQDATQQYIKKDISNSHILPLPITLFPPRDIDYKKIFHDKIKIISVGRLTNFKTYNLYMPDIIAHCRLQGWPVEWHVYGRGELEPKLREKIKHLGLSDVIVLHGELPYQNFPDILVDAAMFVGMGTSLLEAGSRGVPAIPAIVHQEAYTYGYLYDLPLYHTGEILDTQPSIPVVDLVQQLLRSDENAYKNECQKTRQYIEHYDIAAIGPKYISTMQAIGNSIQLKKFAHTPHYLEIIKRLRFHLSLVYLQRLMIHIGKRVLPSSIFQYMRSLYMSIQRKP